jgi:predicted nucleic acid-binding protein
MPAKPERRGRGRVPARARLAARIGARKGLKLVDAIHFSAALEPGCDVFVTNDSRIRSSDGLEVVLLENL